MKREVTISLSIFLLLLGALPLGAQQTKAPPPETKAPAATAPAPAVTTPAMPAAPAVAPDKVVLKVGDKQVTAGEMEAMIRTLPPQTQRMMVAQGRHSMGDQYATLLALSQKAVSEHLNDDPDFKQKMALQEAQYLAQSEYRKIDSGIKVSPEEISQYYDAHKADYEKAEIRQVTVRKKADNAKEGTPGLTATEARTRSEAIKKELLAGADPAKVAEENKTPTGTVNVETAPRTVRRNQIPPDMAKAFDLKDGEITDLVENPSSVYFIQMVKHTPADAKDFSTEIEGKVHADKMQAAVNGLKDSSKVWLDPDFFAAPAPAPAPTLVPATPPASAPPQ